MAYEQRDNSGSLFKNEKTNEKAPDYKGKAMINGKMMKLSAWLKDSSSGKKYMSLSFQPDEGPKEGPRPPKPPAASTVEDQEVPF